MTIYSVGNLVCLEITFRRQYSGNLIFLRLQYLTLSFEVSLIFQDVGRLLICFVSKYFLSLLR